MRRARHTSLGAEMRGTPFRFLALTSPLVIDLVISLAIFVCVRGPRFHGSSSVAVVRSTIPAVAAAAVEGAGEGASARVEEAEEAAEEEAAASKAAEKEKENAADGEVESTTGGAADAAGN